jgi:hypothetical protein
MSSVTNVAEQDDIHVITVKGRSALAMMIALAQHQDVAIAVGAADALVQDWRYGRDGDPDLEVQVRPDPLHTHERLSCKAVFLYVSVPDSRPRDIEPYARSLRKFVQSGLAEA